MLLSPVLPRFREELSTHTELHTRTGCQMSLLYHLFRRLCLRFIRDGDCAPLVLNPDFQHNVVYRACWAGSHDISSPSSALHMATLKLMVASVLRALGRRRCVRAGPR